MSPHLADWLDTYIEATRHPDNDDLWDLAAAVLTPDDPRLPDDNEEND